MAECDGSDGDTSGVQKPPALAEAKTPRPLLGNLPISNPYKLLCETTLKELDFPGTS